ncbi:MAG: PEP-CTERM sorting domain-containing protein [Planctomycetota bacterium]
MHDLHLIVHLDTYVNVSSFSQTEVIDNMVKKSLMMVAAVATCGTISIGADAGIITGYTTSNGAVDGNLQSITTADGTYNDLSFSTATNVLPTRVLSWDGSALPDPANVTEALSDERVDTGSLGTGAAIFNVSPTSGSDQLFIFFNAADRDDFYQGLGEIIALDSGGGTLGTVDLSGTVNRGDEIGAFTLDGITGRLILGTTVEVSAFGVADPTTIASFQVLGDGLTDPGSGNTNVPGNIDTHMVGVAVIPEPSALGLAGAGLLCMFGSRRRK